MRYSWLSVILLFSFVVTAQAKSFNPITDDVCTKIPGIWAGTFFLNNKEDCDIYKGCLHTVSAEITYVSGITYQVNLKPSVGQSGIYNITCENGKMTLLQKPDGSIRYLCSDFWPCRIVYEDKTLASAIYKIEL